MVIYKGDNTKGEILLFVCAFIEKLLKFKSKRNIYQQWQNFMSQAAVSKI